MALENSGLKITDVYIKAELTQEDLKSNTKESKILSEAALVSNQRTTYEHLKKNLSEGTTVMS
jgi:hypothetical protein